MSRRVRLWSPERCNCLVWLWMMRLRHRLATRTPEHPFGHPGYTVSRPTDWAAFGFRWWAHYLWSPDLSTFYAYVPLGGHRKRLFPPLLFRGRVEINDRTHRKAFNLLAPWERRPGATAAAIGQ